MIIHGSCHSRNMSLTLGWEPDPLEIPARACSCSFCSKHGGVRTSNPNGSLSVKVEEPALVSRYEFGTRTAVFHICSRYGVVPVVTSQIDNQPYAVVSVHALDGVAPSLIRHAPVNFDGESEEVRLARRKRNWIPSVRYIKTSA